MSSRVRLVAVCSTAGLLAAGLFGGNAAASSPPSSGAALAAVVPGAEWATAAPQDVGLDAAVLDELAFGAGGNGSSCFVVVRHGYVAANWNWNGWTGTETQEVFSATKSITSALVGAAVADGAIDIAQPAADFIPEWQGTPSAGVTIDNLLSNDSGREWTAAIDYGELPGSPDRSALAVGLGQDAPPGTVWAYNNAAIQTLSEVLQTATGVEPAEYAEDVLFGPIGMARTDMTTDAAGNTAMFMGAQSNCLDLARFGLLFLNGGSWNGTQVLPAEWVEASIGQPSQDLTSSYGYLWWLNRPGTVADTLTQVDADAADEAVEGQMVEGAPQDMYWALGLGNQIVQVDPGSDTVVVRVGAIDGAFGPADTARVVTDALLN